MVEIAILLAVVAVYAFMYARMAPDPDWAMFNLWGFTGSKYGKDFLDCKSPAIHLWYLAISKVVGRSVERVRAMHTVLVSLPAIPLYFYTGDLLVPLAYVVLINTGWLLTFHGNVGQPAAALIVLAIIAGDEWVAASLVVLAVLFEPKLILSAGAMFVVSGWWAPLGAYAAIAGLAAAYLYRFQPTLWGWLVEANITIPSRMVKLRKGIPAAMAWMPWFTAQGILYTLPWLGVAWLSGDQVLSTFWIPPAILIAITFIGIAVRPNHLIPLVGWVVGAMAIGYVPSTLVIALVVVDWVSGGLYLGDIWLRFYHGIRDMNIEAREAGRILSEMDGTLWVSDMHSAIYVYAEKPIMYGMAEQIEIRETAFERREHMVKKMNENPPDFIVTGGSQAPNLRVGVSGYEKIAEGPTYHVYKRTPAATIKAIGG